MIKRSHGLIEKKRERLAMAEDSDAEDVPEIDSDDENLDDDDEELPGPDSTPSTLTPATSSARKIRVLTIASRGIVSRYRHLLKDLQSLLPHARKEPKMDPRDPLSVINEVAELRSCTHAVYFDTRKHRDLYLSFSRCPDGPTLTFHVTNVHTMAELNLSGNCLRGSRGIVSFDGSFGDAGTSRPEMRLAREMLGQVFSVPRYHNRSKPFVDHVVMFSVQDGQKIWMRVYQVVEQGEKRAEDRTLAEIGPRMVMEPVRFFAGSFGGSVIWANKDFVSPNAEARAKREMEAVQREARQEDLARRQKANKELMAERAKPTPLETLYDDDEEDNDGQK